MGVILSSDSVEYTGSPIDQILDCRRRVWILNCLSMVLINWE